MFDPSQMAQPLPPEAMGAPVPAGGAPAAAPPGDPAGAQIPPELLAAMGGGDPMGGAPMEPPMGGTPPGGNPYPTADPNFMSQVLGQILQMQQMDTGRLAAEQQGALTSSPMFQALMSGAPMGPGAGQDGQAMGAPAGIAPPMEGDMGGMPPMADPMADPMAGAFA